MQFFFEENNRMPNQVKMTQKRLYAYSTYTHIKKGWIKWGDTIEEDVRVRIKQQFNASNPEGPYYISSPEGFPLRDGDTRDHQFHDFLEAKGIERLDLGGGEEWFDFGTDDPVTRSMELYNEYFYDVVGKIDSYKADEPQQACLDKMMASWSLKDDKTEWSFGLFAKCRFGKTVSSYWFCNDLFEKIDKKKGIKIGIFSYKPNSVVEAWREPIERHVDFASYEFRDLREGIPETSMLANTIDFCSMQGLIDKKSLFGTSEEIEVEDEDSGALTTRDERINHVLRTEYDIIFFDEVHYGIRSEAAILFVAQMKSKNGFVYLSGTPFAMLKEGMFHADDQYVWTLNDETKYKRANPDSRLGKMPDVETFILDVFKYIQDENIIDLYTEDDQFSHNKAQQVDKNGNYIHDRYWRSFLDIIQPNVKIRSQSPNRNKWDKKIVKGVLSPYNLPNIQSHELDTQVWVLHSIASCGAMKKMLEAHQYWGKEYKIIQLTGGNKKWTEKSLNNTLKLYEKKGIKSICLTVEKFMEGVTIKPWTSIWLLQDWTSANRYGQSTLRVQNEYCHPIHGQKKKAYVFDFSVNRTLIVRISEAQVFKGEKSETEYLRESLDCCPVWDWNDQLEMKKITIPDLYKPLQKKSAAELITSTYMLNMQNLHKFEHVLAKFSKNGFSKAVKKDIMEYIIKSRQYKQTKTGTDTRPPELNAKTLKQLASRAKNLLKKLAYLVFLTDSRIESVDDLCTIDDETYELVYRGNLNKTDLQSIISHGMIDEHRLNQWLTKMVLILHSSEVNNDIDEILDVLHTENTEMRTPRSLVIDMISRIPLHILQDPSSTYLDPCCGQGTFLRILAETLDEKLADSIPNQMKRRRHIWEKMLHAYDIDKLQINTTKKILSKLGWFVKSDNIRYNISNRNYLEEEINMIFDVVIGNPPYNGPVGTNKTHSLWRKFIKKAPGMGTYVLFVTPDTFLSNSKTPELLSSGRLRLVKMLGEDQFEGAKISTAYWLWDKNHTGLTTLELECGDSLVFNCDDPIMFPTSNVKGLITYQIQEKLLAYDEKFQTFSSKIYSAKDQSQTNKYPILNTTAQGQRWSPKKPDDLHDLKILFSNTGNFNPFIDKGTMGTCWHSHSIKVDTEDEANNLLSYLNSKLIRYFNSVNRTGGFSNEIFQYNIPKIDISRQWSDQELYGLFGLSKNEIVHVEELMK